ncbi:YD repeat domain protein [Sulfitobacter noctilucicola]|uniref:Endonuclease/exonuclease/phosphatase (EEP) superfamily protein YafD n=1 Tax=Sulfitobacter noctilucicola TaxID=1342301 RepID=A0A7W6M7E3_9RHOB|nr:endonuclease/exonuclease/phosphatase family protein [Sulfitobacter noctilucicola]KIN62410.1 YD repeat domain protein [Sulfitobacter noctilucicola]MBB4173057.1 endonuclease/exonuclease/phosphatase (EEP) superfamily protein YafD [Sulfitobacter noctilucicola]
MTLLYSFLLWTLVIILVVGTVVPLSKIQFGAVRGFEFPKEQYVVLAIFLAIGLWFFDPLWLSGYGIIGLLVIAAVNLIYIAKFTPIWSRQSLDAKEPLRSDRDRTVSVIAANVKKSNRDYGRLIDLVREKKPDIVLSIEVDQDWIDALKDGLGAEYEHWIDVPLDSGYGICVMSKLPMTAPEVRELITDGVPSIRAEMRLRGGERFRLYVVHPEPPVIEQDTKGRDSEIALIGLEAADDDLPTIVAGDLNDVAWSTTTRRFQRLSGLLDPRVGRGFYNTFSATMPWMRWPLDHLFHDPQFRLVEMARLRKIGSDHFPMWFVLALARTEASNGSVGEAEPGEDVSVKRMIVEERNRERDAIGTDWEDED